MNIDEAKAWLTDLREKHCLPKNRFERECAVALDIALWLLEREEPYVRECIDALDFDDYAGAVGKLDAWEKQHPRPGS